MAQRILRDKLSIRNIRAEAYALALSAPDSNVGSSPNEIQNDQRKKVEVVRIDYPDEFTLESVKERLDAYDIETSPDCLALADITIMLCLRPAEVTTLCITDEGVTGYAKNRGQPDVSRKFRSLEKNQERVRLCITSL
ncbi:hypothetical protein Glove_645g8 [Diversispora epigaea]|uniref:Uncharacterized protein n=1 Tax=Diversispora epigaea TaxID=1348612 RepID=A0A397G8B8_9GLOM|nr:hypothetical protein Glove_645g8 [Diversispora epigaea]